MDGGSCHPGLVPYDFFPSLSLKRASSQLRTRQGQGKGGEKAVDLSKGPRNSTNQCFLILMLSPKQNQI